MFLSYRWLQRHVDLTGISPEQVAADLTIHTAEVEGVEPFAPWLNDVLVGAVLTREKHPDADRLSVCTVDIGADDPLQIVCGAPNVDAGQKVAVGRVGTVLPGDLKLKKSKIRGVESRGMICSVRELELGDEHDGIWVLPADAPVGEPVGAALGMTDSVIEIENKSLTHRPDLWGHRGIAGEIAAIRGLELKPLDLELPPCGNGGDGDAYPVAVETEGCSRYLGLPIHGVRVEAAPQWMRCLLLAVGQRPIDLLVDISNFVMLDLGQPNHLFDMRQLAAGGIVVRDARQGERMHTLDDVEREFCAEDMLITSGDQAVAVAGVMGGQGSRVEADTTELLLEVAAFHPTRVRRTAARLGLRTDASTRFEKSLDPTLPAKAAAHLVRTLQSIQPEVSLPRAMGDAGRWTDPAHTLSLRPERVREILGAPVEDERIERILTSLHFGVERSGSGAPWRVTVPSERATKDVGIEEDLIEEVGRMYGYGEIDERLLVGEIQPAPRDDRRDLVRGLQDRLAGAARFREALTHTFQAEELLTRIGASEQPFVHVLNPQIDTYDRIRRDVLPSLLAVLENNRRQRTEVRLFEVGKGYRPEEKSERGEPREVHQLALVWCAPRPEKKARFDAGVFPGLQGVVEDLLRSAGRETSNWRAATAEERAPWDHPGRCIVLEAQGVVARLATLEPGAQRALGLTGELDSEVAVAEVSIDALLAAPQRAGNYQPIPRFPSIKVDVALALDESVSHAEVHAALLKAGKGLVRSVELFDLYRGASLGAGKKSLAYHVLLQSQAKTLTDKDATKFLSRVERAATELGGELRKE